MLIDLSHVESFTSPISPHFAPAHRANLYHKLHILHRLICSLTFSQKPWRSIPQELLPFPTFVHIRKARLKILCIFCVISESETSWKVFTFIYILIFTYLLGGYISIYLQGVGREAWGLTILLCRLQFVNTIYILYTYYPPHPVHKQRKNRTTTARDRLF